MTSHELHHKCIGCEASEETVILERCRMCFRYFCGDCAHRTRGARFCSIACGEFFMHGDGDDEEED